MQILRYVAILTDVEVEVISVVNIYSVVTFFQK